MEEKGEASAAKFVCEGKAKITFGSSNEVFYNPVQIFNRDLSVACIQVYNEELFHLTVKYKKKSGRTRKGEGEKECTGRNITI